MCDAESFIETLKRIGFERAKDYKPRDFEEIFSDEKLKPLLESICNLNEDNVLTSEELAEYASIPPTELARLEKLAEKDSLVEELKTDDKRDEIQYLEEHLAIIDKKSKYLQHQKNLLKSHENDLLQEKCHYEQVLVEAKNEFDSYAVHGIPIAENEMCSTLKSIIDVICVLQDSITDSESDSEIFPSSIFKDIEVYFDDEKKILAHIEGFLQEHFEVQNDTIDFTLKIEGYSPSKLLQEVHFLKNVLKKSKFAEYEAMTDKEKMKAKVEFYKKFEDKNFPHIFEISSSQLNSKLGEETKRLEQLMEKEKLLKQSLENAVKEHIETRCDEIGIAHCKQIIQCYNFNLKKLQTPLEHLIIQRSRLELILLFLKASKKHLESLKHLIDLESQFENEEKETLKKIKSLCEETEEKEPKARNDYVTADSVLLTVYKVLNDTENQELAFVLPEEVLHKVGKLFDEETQVEQFEEEKVHVVEFMAKQRSALEKIISSGKEFSKLLEMDKDVNIKLNKLNLKIMQVQRTIADHQKEMNSKKQILERNPNLSLSRDLYLSALLNEDSFADCIEKIKVAAGYENEDSSFNDSTLN